MKDYLSDFFEHVMLSLAAVAMFVLAYGASFAVLYNLISFVLSKLGVSNKIVIGVSLIVISVVSLLVCHGMKDMKTRSENMAEPMFCISLLLFALGIFVCFFKVQLFYNVDEIKQIKSDSYFAGYDAGYEAACNDSELYSADDMEYRSNSSYQDGYLNGFDFGFYAGWESCIDSNATDDARPSNATDIQSKAYQDVYNDGLVQGWIYSDSESEWNRAEFLADIEQAVEPIRSADEMMEDFFDGNADGLDVDEVYSLVSAGLRRLCSALSVD